MTSSLKYLTFDQRLKALQLRDPDAEGHFVYCVVSTNIYCRPTCPSRLPLAKNITFCDSVEQARNLKFRPCKRCKPDVATGWNRTRECIVKACAYLEVCARHNRSFDAKDLARRVGLSRWHFCRTFKNYTGVTTKTFYRQCREGKNLLSSLLPLIRTKKYLQRMRQESSKEEPRDLERWDDWFKWALEDFGGVDANAEAGFAGFAALLEDSIPETLQMVNSKVSPLEKQETEGLISAHSASPANEKVPPLTPEPEHPLRFVDGEVDETTNMTSLSTQHNPKLITDQVSLQTPGKELGASDLCFDSTSYDDWLFHVLEVPVTP